MKTIKQLTQRMKYDLIQGREETEIQALIYDSRKVSRGCIFVCLKGAKFDSHVFSKEAVENGAVALVIQEDIALPEDEGVAVLKVADTRMALAFLSTAWFGYPAEQLKTIGITGTKGKTTTTYMIKSILENAGHKVGLIGTIEAIIGDRVIPANNTTPESYITQEYFQEMVEAGCDCVVMEVSSQGLMMSRVGGILFDIGIFTNIEPDHIGPNEHGSFEEYMYWKSTLFQQCKVGIVNQDDVHYPKFIQGHTCEIETFGIDSEADLRATKIHLVQGPGYLGIAYDVEGLVNAEVEIDMPGRFSVYNSLTAIAVCRHFGVDLADMKRALKAAKVKGRIEMIPVSDEFTLMIDYAHNAMSLESLLTTLKEYKPERLVVLFGNGGNRSRDRRFEMGAVAGRLSDLTIITSDNPRDEDPQAIIDDIKTGMAKTKGKYVEIIDRKEAIRYAITHGQPGDVIVLAGKGHEDYQEIKGKKYPLDERVLIQDILEEERGKKRMRDITIGTKKYGYYDIAGTPGIEKLPYSLRMLLESLVRQKNGSTITQEHIDNLLGYLEDKIGTETAFLPSRVVLQDFTGVPAVVDLAAMRDAAKANGVSPKMINPQIPVDLVIDHSMQVDASGTENALEVNAEYEFERNEERYEFLKWAEGSFDNFRVVPPETGIIHQVNIEYLSDVIQEKDGVLFPDSVFGTDSHTTMINGLGILGWGVGGIEAEAVMLGEASSLVVPEVIGVEFVGELGKFATATDLALTVTHLLRKENVVGKFVEFFGTGMEGLSLADRATVANMAPEYGATCGYFPIDGESLRYLKNTNRSLELVEMVEQYTKTNKLFYDPSVKAHYTKVVVVDLSQISSCLSGPSRPQDRIELGSVSLNFRDFVKNKRSVKERDGRVAIAAITSCTNTSNPHVMMMAGLLAKKAVEKGLKVPSYVKTSLTPGSKAVTAYLERAGLLPYLDQLGFGVAGYGCATCIGNSGPLRTEMEKEIIDEELIVASVLSGNRNFEGRIHALVKANYLASPPLVVAYAIAGTVQKDLTKESLGLDSNGKEVFLADIFPEKGEVEKLVDQYITAEIFADCYGNVFDGNVKWNAIKTTAGEVYDWKGDSTYISDPPYFDGFTTDLPIHDILSGMRVLGKFGDSVTTDHISPAGSIQENSPAGVYLKAAGVVPRDFNSYGSRRGNDKVMARGTFANIRIRNQILEGVEGGYGKYEEKVLPIYDVAKAYQEKGIGLVILAGKDYGMGSSRDWAAKGSKLQGIKAVIAKSFERIHRSNLVMMGILPLEFMEGEDADSLGLTGEESYTIELSDQPKIHDRVTVYADDKSFEVLLRFDSQADQDYYANDGIMPYVLRKLMKN